MINDRKSFSKDKSYDLMDEKMFYSMKETLHRPLQKIKSKDLINCFYNQNNSNKMLNIRHTKNSKEAIRYKDINEEYNTSSNTNPEYNNNEKSKLNDMINNTSNNENLYNTNKKKLMKEIEDIKRKINTFNVIDEKKDITSTNNNNDLFPFEFINYSISDAYNTNTKNNNNSKSKKKIRSQNLSKEKKNTIYSREMAYKEKKEKKIEKMRKKEIEDEKFELKFRPKINKISKKMSKGKPPIYKRLKEIEVEKNNKLEKIKDQMNENKTELILGGKQKFNEEEFKKWLVLNENWNVKKIIKLNNIKNDILNEENANDELVFRPKIDKNSEKIFKINKTLSSLPVSQRLCYPKETNLKKYEEEKYTFIPEVNKNYPISCKYYEFMDEDQFKIYNDTVLKNK